MRFPGLSLSLAISLTITQLACARSGALGEATEAPAADPTAVYLPTVLAEDNTPAGVSTENELLTSAGETRQYRLFVPGGYSTGTAVPLVLNLHGLNSDPVQQEDISQFSVKAQAETFIVVYPAGTNGDWNFVTPGSPDEVFLSELIVALQGAYAIDAQRIYVTGISNGAEMAYELVCHVDVFAAAGFVSGAYPRVFPCHDTPLPAVGFHGTDDNFLPYNGNALFLPVLDWAQSWADRNGCTTGPTTTYQQGEVTGQTWTTCTAQADVVFYTVTGKGHSWPGSSMPPAITTQDIDATDALWAFFAAHQRP